MTPEELKRLAELMLTGLTNDQAKAVIEKARAESENARVEKMVAAALERAELKAKDAAALKAIEDAKGTRETVEANFSPAPSATPDVSVGKDMVAGTGLNIVRTLLAKGAAALEGNPGNVRAAAIAKARGYHDVSKALLQGTYTAGGNLVHPQFASELVPLLRNKVTLRKAGARQIPMSSATLRFDRQTGAATATYSGENVAITPSEQTTDSFELSEKKLTGLVAVSNDLIRNASVGVEEFVRDDLVNVMALKEDYEFLRGDGSSYKPLGIRFRLTTSFNETITTEGAPTLNQMLTELSKCIKTLKAANIPMVKPVWIGSSWFEHALFKLTGPGGEGANILAMEYATKGTLRGYPVFISNQVPTTCIDTGTGALGSAAGNDRTEIYLVDMNEVVIGDSMALEAEFFPNATYSNSGTIVSGISNDSSVIRAISKHDIGMLHNAGAVCVNNSSWGQ
jgi:HK97 family phage major capsid protein